jgi:diguanylate cyclase (GGDEF)-like protein
MEYALFPTVGEIAQKNICRVGEETTVREAARLMDERGISSVIIERQDLRYLFTVEDLLQFASLGRDDNVALGSVLSHRVQCIQHDERVLAALERLEGSNDRYLGVIDRADMLIGVVTYTDILSSIDPSVLVEKKTIGELISRNAPITFTADWILEDVLCHLNRLEDAIIVVEGRVPIGIVTTKDLFKIIATGQHRDIPLASVMTSPVATTRMSSSIHEVLLHLKSLNIKRTVVVNDQNEVAGIVTQSQLVGFAYGAWINLIKYHSSELREIVGILEAKASEYEKQAMTDPLTGLVNRRVLEQKITEEMERIRRYNAPSFSVAMIDIDYFKRVNDTYGHLAGDKVLCALSEELKQQIRKCDIAARWGSEKFAIFMPQTTLAQATLLAERLLQHVAGISFLGQVSLTLSIGVGEFILAGPADNFMSRVEQALQRAKHLGRNRVEQAGDSTDKDLPASGYVLSPQ